jgi:hypothetical protein
MWRDLSTHLKISKFGNFQSGRQAAPRFWFRKCKNINQNVVTNNNNKMALYTLTTDELNAACILQTIYNCMNQSGDFIIFTMTDVLGKVTTCEVLNEDGSIDHAQVQPSGNYVIEYGLYIAVQRHSYNTIILWCKWAYFDYDMGAFTVSNLKLIVHRQFALYLFSYIDRAVLWAANIDPLVKFLSALTMHSLETMLCYSSTSLGLPASRLFGGLEHKFAKAFSRGSLWRQAFYVACMTIIAHTCAYEDAVYKRKSLDKMRTWMQLVFPRNESSIWSDIDFPTGVHELYSLLDLDVFDFRFDYDFVHHTAEAAQGLLNYSGAPCVDIDVILDSYFRYKNGQALDEFTPIEVNASSDEASSPVQSSRKDLLPEFNRVHTKIDELVVLLEADSD